MKGMMVKGIEPWSFDTHTHGRMDAHTNIRTRAHTRTQRD